MPAVLLGEAPLALAPVSAADATWPEAQWWRVFHDDTLDQLIEGALEASPTLATAHARFNLARESVKLAGADTGVKVIANGSFERQRLSNNGLFLPSLLGFNWYNEADLGLSASYSFDWWGKQHDLIASAMDEAHAAEADRAAAALILTSSIADSYFAWQMDQGRLALMRERLDLAERTRLVNVARLKAELDHEDLVRRSEGDSAALREQIAFLEGSARLRLVTLAALLGRSTDDLPALTPKALPHTTPHIPDNVRIDLLARRPDIAAGRWRVEAAQMTRHSVRSEFLPDISVNALAGLSSIKLGKLIETGSGVPAAGIAIHLPLFDSGRLKARYGISEAQVNAAITAYRETLVSAAQEVATQAALRAQLAAQTAQRQLEVAAAERLRDSAIARERQGITDRRPTLAATDNWLLQRDALLQLDASNLSIDIGLIRALGGGYDSSQPWQTYE
jgi:multidrug efflux system outer membrane protein